MIHLDPIICQSFKYANQLPRKNHSKTNVALDPDVIHSHVLTPKPIGKDQLFEPTQV